MMIFFTLLCIGVKMAWTHPFQWIESFGPDRSRIRIPISDLIADWTQILDQFGLRTETFNPLELRSFKQTFQHNDIFQSPNIGPDHL